MLRFNKPIPAARWQLKMDGVNLKEYSLATPTRTLRLTWDPAPNPNFLVGDNEEFAELAADSGQSYMFEFQQWEG